MSLKRHSSHPLVVVTVNTSWNVYNFRRGLVSALIAQGYHVTVLAPDDHTTEKLSLLGCDTRHLEMNAKGLSVVGEAALLWSMRRHLKALRPDAVLGFTIKNNLYGALAARTLGIPFIPTVTGLGTAFLSGSTLQGIAQTLYRLAFRRCPVVIFQNVADRDLFLECGLVRPHQVAMSPGSGVDLDHFAPRPAPEARDRTVFLFIGRMLADKGVRELVEAARHVRARHPDCEFRFLGPMGKNNRSAIPDAEVRGWIDEGTITYLGPTDDVRPHIADADCVVLPSYREGSPRTLMEAAAMARPVITTDVPGCRDVVDPGRSALLCRVRDAVDLRQALELFLSLPFTQRQAMGVHGRKKMVRDYDLNIIISLYAEIIKKNSAGERTHSTSLKDN